MALLDQCSWAYSDPTHVVEGQTFYFAAAVPPMVQTGGLTGTLLDTATAATIVWRVTDAALNPNPLVAGDDYQIVSGGLDQMSLALVVNPSLRLRTPPINQFKVQPILTVAGGGAQVISNVPPPLPNSPWLPVTYTLAPPTDLGGKALKLLTAALQLTSSADLVEPGDSVTLKVVPNAITSAPQVVTNLVHELPEVKIRGAIPLGALAEAIIGPLAGAVSAALPSSTDSVTGAVGDVANLLAEALAIPIAIDVGGRKVTRTLAPLTTDLITTVTSAPEDAQNLTGAVPIDNFLADFKLSAPASWRVTETNSDRQVVCSQKSDLSPSLNLIKTLLLLPDVIALESLPNQVIPTPVDVTVLLQFELGQLGLTGANAVKVKLGPVTLLRLPLVLPQIAAVFGNALGDWTSGGGQKALLTTDSVGAKLMPSLDAIIRLLSTLSSVLDTFAKATTLGVAADPNGDWENLLGLGQGVRLLVALLGRIPQRKIYFQQTYPGDEGGDRVILDNDTLGNDDWDDKITAAIHIGVPYRDSGKWFRLSDANGEDWLDFNNPNAPFSFVSIVGNLNVNYDQSKRCFPPNTAQPRDSARGHNMDNKLERLEFLIQF
jgi:hypothetical protein